MKITNLTANKLGTPILKNLTLDLEEGKTHIIMGPNGSGKSTLTQAITGHPDVEIESGSIIYNDKNFIDLEIEERSLLGLYLAPQYPPVIEGLSHAAFLKEATNVRLDYEGKEPVDDFQFLKKLDKSAKQFNFEHRNYAKTSLNNGFSGGEKKRNEMLQISLLNPNFVILDEIDSGLDIEAMSMIAEFIVHYQKQKPNRTTLIITHYPQFAELLQADYIHILKNGSIVKTGDYSLVDTIVKDGFGGF